MKKKLIWPGALFVMIGLLVALDVTMLILSSGANIYTVVPTEPTDTLYNKNDQREVIKPKSDFTQQHDQQSP